MKYLLQFVIVSIILSGCNTKSIPDYPDIHITKKDNKLNEDWKSLNYPQKEGSKCKVFNVITNSANDLFASDNQNNLYVMYNKDNSWRLIKNYFNFISFIFIDTSGEIFIGINDSEGNYGSTVETPDSSGSKWETTYSSPNNINGLRALNENLYLVKQGGIAVSENNGKDWNTLSNELGNKNVMDITINKLTGNLFIGTGSGEILKSTDSGKTWKQSGSENGPFFSLISTGNGFVYAVSKSLFVTKNDGNTWQTINMENREVEITSITLTSKEFIVVGTKKHGILLSKDYGNSWISIGPENTAVLSLCTDSDDYIYAGTNSGIFKSVKRFSK